MRTFNDTNDMYFQHLHDIYFEGQKQTCRGYQTRELLHHTIRVPMSVPLVTIKARRLGYRFACAEAAWILDGDNRLATIKPFSKTIHNFSDDGIFMSGAYGPKVVEQLSYVVDSLVQDPGSRQAVLTIWRERPRPSRDVPCTVSIQFLIRDGFLHIIDTMRSSDAWLGVPYDLFSFSMVGAAVALLLRDRGIEVLLGDLYLCAGSAHLYEGGFGYTPTSVEKVLFDPEALEYAPLDLSEFGSYQDLVGHLWALARQWPRSHKWLSEIPSLKVLATPTLRETPSVATEEDHAAI
jgi:thymidylate synthase